MKSFNVMMAVVFRRNGVAMALQIVTTGAMRTSAANVMLILNFTVAKRSALINKRFAMELETVWMDVMNVNAVSVI